MLAAELKLHKAGDDLKKYEMKSQKNHDIHCKLTCNSGSNCWLNCNGLMKLQGEIPHAIIHTDK